MCPVREDAKDALKEIKTRKENMVSAPTPTAITTVSKPVVGNNQIKQSEIIGKGISKKANTSEPGVVGETTKTSRTKWYIALGIILTIIVMSVFVFTRKKSK